MNTKNKLRLGFGVVSILVLTACSTIEKSNRKIAGQKNTSLNTILYTWTNRPEALSDPNGFIKSALSHVTDCIEKMKKTEKEIPGCSGSGLFAGPGLYTVDNPFTSSDYGNTVVVVKAKAGSTRFGDATYGTEYYDPQVGVSQDLLIDESIDAILYTFRNSNLNSNALVVRSPQILDSKAESFKIGDQGFKTFSMHPQFVCNQKSTVADVLKNWGDHMYFLSTVYFAGNDPSGEDFKTTAEFNPSFYAAAFASDAVAISDLDLDSKFELLKKNEVKFFTHNLSKDACGSTVATNSKRFCLAQRIYSSLVVKKEDDIALTYALRLPESMHVFKTLGLISEQEAQKIKSQKDFLQFAKVKMSPYLDNIKAAYDCAKQVESSIQKSHLGLWIE